MKFINNVNVKKIGRQIPNNRVHLLQSELIRKNVRSAVHNEKKNMFTMCSA